MANVNQEWRVLRHRPIEKLEENLWCVTGSLRGMALKRVMSLVRLADGRIAIHSAIALDEASMRQIENWGRPAILLVPNAYHRLDAPAYVARYPQLEVFCPRGSRRRVEQVVRVNGDYDEFAGDASLELRPLDGIGAAEGVALVRSKAGTTLVFNDAVFNMPHARGVAGVVFRHLTQSTGGPRVSRLFRWFAVKDKAALAASLNRLAATPGLIRIVVSHHLPISDCPAEVLRKVAATLA